MPPKKTKGKKKVDATDDDPVADDSQAKPAKGKKRAAPVEDESPIEPAAKKVKDSQKAPSEDFFFAADDRCNAFRGYIVHDSSRRTNKF